MKENNWFDPFYIQTHLSEEESNIQKNVRDFCNNELKPTVVERNRKNEFEYKMGQTNYFLSYNIRQYHYFDVNNHKNYYAK